MGGEGSEKTKERRNEWHTVSEESGQLLYNNKGHVGRKRDGGEREIYIYIYIDRERA